MRSTFLSLTGALMIVCAAQTIATCQNARRIIEHKRFFQLSLFPGISTNGLNSATYSNDFSLNLLGGISAGNRILELGLITNSSLREVSGIQIAGLANIVGANTFLNLTPTEQYDLIQDGVESSSHGVQIASLLNYVRDNSRALQLTAGMNVVGLDFRGFQLAGIGNSSGANSAGAQVAGFYNIAHESMTGIQFSTSFNYTNGRLSGAQVGLVNKARKIDGRNSAPATTARGLQIGLINLSRQMNGAQVGLINFGGAMRGNQFGVVNFFRKTPTKENVRLGTPVGLINIGSVGSVARIYFNEIFPLNFEYTTGNCLNCTVSGMGKTDMPYNDSWKKLNQNALIAGYDPRYQSWGIGYGFIRILLNKVVMVENPDKPRNAKHMISYGARVLHLNSTKADPTFNLLTRLHFEYGYKKWFRWHYYAGLSMNYFIHQGEQAASAYHINAPVLATGMVGKMFSSLWPGYSLGIQL